MKKSLDDKHLTPIRPIRRVGDDNWPAAKDQPAPARETTGQSAKQDAPKQESRQDTAQNMPKPDAKQSQNPKLGNQAPPPDKPQDSAQQKADPRQDTANQNAAKPDNSKQDTAKQDSAKSDSQPESNSQNTAKNSDQDSKDDKGFASIRLGTDKDGRVAVNDAQEKQISKAIRKQHVDTFNVKVSVGSVAPANVKLASVSSDFVDIMPQFRGYSFFATREEIVIVEPSSRKVVALVPVSLTATASRPSEERSPRSETRRTETRTTSRTRERDVTVGRSAQSDGFPTREEILAAPVVREQATVRSYRYYEPDDDVVIIERRRPRIFGFW
jgi:hypothetical protein